ncbi:MAG: alpha/beta hydrolase [Acholeplasmataceae bacterium]
MKSIFLNGNKQKPAILLLHGFGGNLIEMQELGMLLAQLGHTVSIPLHPGHGMTFKDFLNTKISLWYEHSLAEYDRLKETYDKVIVMGLSMGGAMTLRIGIDREPYKLVSMSAPLIAFTQEQMEVHTRDEINRHQEINHMDKDRYYEIFYHIKQENNRFYEDDKKYLSKITSPILVIQGLKDHDRYKESSKMIIEGVNSKVVMHKYYEASGHVITMDKEKQEVFKDIIEFVGINHE